jgi:hypothetical protein
MLLTGKLGLEDQLDGTFQLALVAPVQICAGAAPVHEAKATSAIQRGAMGIGAGSKKLNDCKIDALR